MAYASRIGEEMVCTKCGNIIKVTHASGNSGDIYCCNVSMVEKSKSDAEQAETEQPAV